jgi:diguanylate cyclase (GGDEF)-like protein/PAS domain S-box-containing protein
MPILDLRTILIVYICGNFICAVVLTYLWQQNINRYPGLGYWAASFFANLFGLTLLTLRGTIPDFFSMLVGGIALICGTFFLYIGINRFFTDRIIPKHIFAYIAIYIVLQIYFIYIKPNLEIRNVLFSAVLVLFSIEFVHLLFWKMDPEKRKNTRVLGIVTTFFGILASIRIALNIIIPPGVDPMHASWYEAWLYLSFQLLYIILTISLFMLVNRRLIIDLESDISKRKQIEDDLQVSQEKFAKAFKVSPNAILITRISDGLIIDFNDSFLKFTGFTRSEIENKTTVMINFWAIPEDRKLVVEEMRKNLSLKNTQFDFRVKSGAIFRGEISSEYIKLGDDDCMLSVIQDVTERERMQDILHLRLKLWEYSLSHSAVEVMEKALDEIEVLTGSLISFYHLVDEDLNSLSLQAWSTRTKMEYCRAEGTGMHYSIDQAGVWVDCIRERKTVIHNDYASLTGKKGLPDGHSPVLRELLVPIFQKDQIVSILGVGNKPTDYDQNDAEFVEYIASLVWTIVSKKRADEKIQQLHEKLANLAMIDELTNLPNRRAFFLRGAEEISRSKRYKAPLSMIMLDIDRFKDINDSYGHTKGDDALQCMSKTLREQIREVDLPARLGGEEFGILLPNTKLDEALVIAERIRIAIEKIPSEKEGDECIHMTASFGVASFTEGMKSLDELFSNADTAMYKAKNNGRNQVDVFQ